MAKAEVSVIIPVRNGATFVARAVGSVLTQSLRSLEAIVVDDASEDATPDLIEHVAAHNPRVRAIRLEAHSGPAAARRRGLEHANGRYIGFVDADDVALPGMFETLYRAAAAEDADIAVCNAYRVDERGVARPRTALLRSCTIGRDATLRRFFALRLGGGALWNRLIHAELLARLPLERFDSLPINEDYAVNIGATNLIERCVVVADFLYAYTERIGSVSRTESANGYYLANLLEAWATTSSAYGDQQPALLEGIDKLYHRQLAFGHYQVTGGALSAADAEAFVQAMEHLSAVRPAAARKVGRVRITLCLQGGGART